MRWDDEEPTPLYDLEPPAELDEQERAELSAFDIEVHASVPFDGLQTDQSGAEHRRRSEFAAGANVCGRKRRYASASAARHAHSRAHWRIRAYECPRCHGWHVTNGEKEGVRGRNNRIRGDVRGNVRGAYPARRSGWRR